MIRRLNLSFLLFSLSISFIAAQNEVDSLRELLSQKEQDTTRVNVYLTFFYTDLYYDNPDQVIAYTEEAAKLSKELNYPKGLAGAYNTLGYMYRIRSSNDSTFSYFNKGKFVAEQNQLKEELVNALTGLGNTNNQIGNWSEALSYFHQVVDVARSMGDSSLVGSAHNNMGNIHLSRGSLTKALRSYQIAAEQGNDAIKEVALINIALVHVELDNPDKARDYFNQGIAMSEVAGSKYNLAFIYQHLGALEDQQQNQDLAIQYFDEAIRLFRSIGEKYNVSDIMTNQANVFYNQEQYQQALDLYQESLAIQQTIDHQVGICNNLLGIGRSLMAKGELKNAENKLLKVMEMADSLELLSAKNAAAFELSNLYHQLNNHDKAYDYLFQHKWLSDSLLNQEKSKQVAALETQFETAQKEQEIELLSAENEISQLKVSQAENYRNYLIVIALILIIVVALIYSRYQLKARANAKLRVLDQLKSNFFTNISHEFRTPLTLILSPLQKLMQAESKPQSKELATIYRSATHMLELTNQLMDLSKLEAGKLTLEVSACEPKEFIQQMAAEFQSIAEDRSIAFTVHIDESIGTAYLDKDKIHKVLNNLLSNAFKFTPTNGQVVLSCIRQGNELKVNVQDTGPGLSERDQLRVFERFQQANISNNQLAGGTGVGLTLTKELVQLHKGEIGVTSAKGEGSTFWFTIPIHQSAYTEKEIKQEETRSSESATLGIIKQEEVDLVTSTDLPQILIVEDHRDLREHLKELLQDHYQVTVAVNGLQAMDLASKALPDLVVTDLMMPDMDGMELCKRLKSDELTSHIPIVMLTAKGDMESRIEGLTYGADDYLTKPFDNEELTVRVKNLIAQRQLLQSRYSEQITLEPSQVVLDNPDEHFIRKALQTVEAFLTDSSFTVEQFQQEMGMSRMQLHRKLKALTNSSASEFIRNIRLERACQLLSQKSLRVSEVAYSCGFNSLSYFNQCFKEKYGVTPANYESKAALKV